MLTRANFILETFYQRSTLICRSCSSVTVKKEKHFFNWHVQDILTKLTRVNIDKVLTPRKDGTPLSSPVFKFMTAEQLKKTQEAAAERLNLRIQMPPVVTEYEDPLRVLSKDTGLQGYTTNKYVITDISYGLKNRERIIVVREPDGTLRHAFMNERSRMQQAYFPVNGKELTTPKMFFDPYLTDLLNKKEYVFILDRACIQFDPDEKEYHRVTKVVYEDINSKKDYELLRSTRHFGPLVFHLAWEKKIDDLLIDLIHTEKIDEAALLIKLFHLFHPRAMSAETAPYENDMTVIKNYAKHDTPNRNDVEHALLVYEELQAQKQKLEKEVTNFTT